MEIRKNEIKNFNSMSFQEFIQFSYQFIFSTVLNRKNQFRNFLLNDKRLFKTSIQAHLSQFIFSSRTKVEFPQ